ncbi:MAG: hypothetical protein JRJ12_16275 [Deltaproteobacteria bacterium]|nr:hypothetical protein [Deltaproteobacteria bacterium]
MKESLFVPLAGEQLTSLRICYERERQVVTFQSAREWTQGEVDWSSYQRSFTYEDPLSPDPCCLGSRETEELFNRYGLQGYLHQVAELIRAGGHQGIECFYEQGRDIRFISHMHSNTLGINNGYHAIRAGGIRRHHPEAREMEVIIDGLNTLQQTFPSAAAK